MIMAERFQLPPVITASKWELVGQNLWTTLRKRRGERTGELGNRAVKMTNREAVALINAVRALAPMLERGFPLWYQFAAAAYGWLPGTDRLDATQARADQLFDPDVTWELQRAANTALMDMRDHHPDVPPRLELESDVFDEPIFQGEVARALHADGARPQFEIPMPFCQDKKTGKMRVPKPPCNKDGKGPIEPVTGRRMPCDKRGDCQTVTIDDPITGITKGLGNLAVPIVIVLIAWAALSHAPRRGRRRRD